MKQKHTKYTQTDNVNVISNCLMRIGFQQFQHLGILIA